MSQITVIVGDIHGMTQEVRQLFFDMGITRSPNGDPVRTEYGGKVRIISAGDALDKGPDSPGTVRYLRLLGVELVEGNHEDSHRRYRAGVVKKKANLAKKGIPFTVDKGKSKVHEITEALSDEDIAWLESAKLWIRLPEYDAIVVHAGIPPVFDRLPSEEELAGLTSGGRSFWEQALRVRYVRPVTETVVTVDYVFRGTPDGKPHQVSNMEIGDPLYVVPSGLPGGSTITKMKTRKKGEFLALKDQDPARDDFWAEVYDGRFGHAYFGHNPYLSGEPRRFAHATGLDTGAVFGATLTAVVLEEGQEPVFHSVKAHAKYANPLKMFAE